MHHYYEDILSRIESPPLWFDENAVPRWCAFAPNQGANIYFEELALVLIECQNCGREFEVAMSWSIMDQIRDVPKLSEQIKDGSLHYGDPPNVRCCPAGPTMNCMDIRVLQFFKREHCEHTRVPELEIALPDSTD